MDIRHWPLTEVMQLPDYCFGRRWLIGLDLLFTGANTHWAISTQSFPTTCVLWNLQFWQTWPNFYCTGLRLSLGTEVPTNVAEFNKLEPLLPGGGWHYGTFYFRPNVYSQHNFDKLRLVLHTNKRRLVMEADGTSGKSTRLQVIATISDIPKKAPNWLVKRKK